MFLPDFDAENDFNSIGSEESLQIPPPVQLSSTVIFGQVPEPPLPVEHVVLPPQ
jgi:hypothetical protein